VTADFDSLLARAVGFDWDEGNSPKITARHRVEPGECEQAFFVEPFVVVIDEKHSADEPRWRALGRTVNDRCLHLVFTFRGDLIRIIHARDMNRKERRSYEKAKKRIEADPDV
jgi:uncharacterized DUF497 family protein